MINVVHQKGLQVDQWTGETIVKRFKIPRKGGKLWGGCYGTPSTALSALADYIETHGLTADEAHELYDRFQASLRREKGFETDKFTSVPAPSWKNLQMWNGGMSLTEYHGMYEHDYQVKAIKQEIVTGKDETDETNNPPPPATGSATDKDPPLTDIVTGQVESSDDEGGTRPPNAPKKWRLTELAVTGQSVESRVDMPRCVAGFVDFLRRNIIDPGVPGAVVLYIHPTQNNIIGVGSPANWHGQVNRAGSDKMGHVPVFGPVRLFHKNKLREGSKKRARVGDQ